MGRTSAGSERHAQILNQAQRLFNQQGFRETNLDDVAACLGIRRQAIYHYFRSKEDILWELVERASTSLAGSAESIFTAELPPDRKLAALVDNHVRQLLGDIEIFRLDVLQRDKLSPDRHESVRKSQREYVRRIAGTIKDGQESGLFVGAPPYVQTLLIIGMCNWALDWYRPEPATTVDDVATETVRLVMAGVSAPRSRVHRR
jgi:TetR/AcrR family transcriptional regulator, cholesterol catabolism regulator